MAAMSGIANRLQQVFGKLRKKGKVGDADIKESMREMRLALLEADVNFKVVKAFVEKVSERALGQNVLKSLTPGQQIIKVVNEELTELMGGEQTPLVQANKPPTIIMLIGLQGAGKTTTAAKLAALLVKQKQKPLLVAADLYRPAAIQQLQQLGAKISVPVFTVPGVSNPWMIAEQALQNTQDIDVVIVDTSGRLHVDLEMMDELKQLKAKLNPHETLLVVDAMTGQDAVNVASSFNEEIGVTGVIMTKLDSDARGGAALSIRSVTNCPLKFVGVGEKIEQLEVFHPERMASRILGMGDVLTLIEKAEAVVDAEQAKALEQKIRNNAFTLEDFLEQMQQMRKMGPLSDILSSIPGLGKGLGDIDLDDKKLDRVAAIIRSMTPGERLEPVMINASRRKRIALGSGQTVSAVNKLLKQFEDMRSMMKNLSQLTGKKKGRGFKLPFFR